MRVTRELRQRCHGHVWLVLTCFCLLVQPVAAATPVHKTILVINEVGLAYPASTTVTQLLLSALSSDSAYRVDFYVESIDAPKMDEKSEDHTVTRLGEEYRDRSPDVIVAMGPEVIKMITRHEESFFPNVPVVICGSSAEQAGNPALGPRYTGSWMKIEPRKTVDAALKLVAGAQRIYVVGGASLFDRGVETVVRTALQSMPSGVQVAYLTDLPMSLLLERVRQLPSHSIVLYTCIFRDIAGNEFINATTALPLVAETANAPVFGMSDMYLGRGVVGGYVISFGEQGRNIADIVLQLFAGARAQDIPISTAPSLFMFDWRQMQRWRLSEARLPVGSVVLNRESTLWHKFKWALLSGALAMMLLTFLLTYLVYNRAQLKRARSEQIELSGKLITALEDERSRLASELHDDFSQRLALLSLGIETTAELVPASSEGARQQLNELLNSASELGADIHTLSHRLHSSTLQRLGLVSGTNAFCKEFSAQQHVKAVFSHDDLDQPIPPDVALALFRIVQEALRNISKHSGASQARVRLTQKNHDLRLSISDDGVGFHPDDPQCRQGLGLFSMKERARLIGAHFQVHSEIGKGTIIEVSAPFSRGSTLLRSNAARA